MFFYSLGLRLYILGIRIASLFNVKAALAIRGRKNWQHKLREAANGKPFHVWMHCASLGEFEQGRPLLEKIKKEYPNKRILLTFFSPSGYEIRKNYTEADAVFYLPFDISSNAKKFISLVNPELAVFIKYEFWLNYIDELKKRKINTLLVSAIFREGQIFFSPHGNAFRKALQTFTAIFVQQESSKKLLSTIGVQSKIAGDTRFDRVFQIASNTQNVDFVPIFSGEKDVLVAGSTWPADEDLLLNVYSNTTISSRLNLILVPHEISKSHITQLLDKCGEKAILLSEFKAYTPDKKILIVDRIGLLSSLYSKAKYAYIGGGFGKGIHNTLEAAVFGIPIFIGPKYSKFQEAVDLIENSAAFSCNSAKELENKIQFFFNDSFSYSNTCTAAAEYVTRKTGATTTIINYIKTHTLL